MQSMSKVIAQTLYGPYLNRCTRDERRQTAFADKYKGPQLVETLQKFLNASDADTIAGVRGGL